MENLDLTTRAEAGAALTVEQHDANLTAIQGKMNAVIAKLALLAADDGTLVNGLIDVVTMLTDNLITLAKLKSLDEADRGKFLRANRTTGAIEAVSLYLDRDADTSAIQSTGAQTGRTLSTFAFENVPAGNLVIFVTLMGRRNAGSNGGTIRLMQDATVLDDTATHGLDGAGTSWMPFTLIGRIDGFAGGTLELELEFETGEVSSDVTFGVDGENRFGRRATVIAGL